MSHKFRPKLETFEDRVVPASFSFRMPDGTVGSGRFSTPDYYDPSEASQTLNVNDLVVTYGGQEYGGLVVRGGSFLPVFPPGRTVPPWRAVRCRSVTWCG